jgi:glycyl-tRNA synthetase beta chain
MLLAEHIGPLVGADGPLAARAAWLAKADLTAGMVGEFPELQGVMGRYYALHDGEDPAVADAIRDHYAPKGPSDAVPSAPVTVAVALADKIDLLAGFFGIGEKPTGGGDPYALRRAALGIIRLVRENGLRLHLGALIEQAGRALAAPAPAGEILAFLLERLRVQMRAEGARHDVLDAASAAHADDDLVRILARVADLGQLLATEDGASLLAGYRRAANILRIEDAKDGPHRGTPDPALFQDPAERTLWQRVETTAAAVATRLETDDYAGAVQDLSRLRAAIDRYFTDVMINAPDPALRRNRLLLLSQVRATMDRVADFSRIEG